MIDFEFLEKNKDRFRTEYLTNQPFPHLAIDNFADEDKLRELYSQIPDLKNKSRDLMFAKNKFEKSNYKELGNLFEELNHDLHSERMNDFLSYISAKKVFVDPKNHGGGLHQGQGNSYLDMHLDFNYHPLNTNWWREMNLLFYLNMDWKKEYGGHLKLEDLRTGIKKEIPVPFNRLVIQECSSYSLHGYDLTSFPEGNYRTSFATYAYVEHIRNLEKPRTTDWFPSQEDSSSYKKFLGRRMKHFVKVKNAIFGSGTAKNQ